MKLKVLDFCQGLNVSNILFIIVYTRMEANHQPMSEEATVLLIEIRVHI